MVQTRAAAKRIESGLPQDVAPSSTKKRRLASALPKKRRTEPGELCQLNLDVLFLLAAYVHPLDLLNLARTCKSLRELLMDKASTFVWKTAREQADGLPDCPADLTEPEYANLAFYARCHGCGKYAKKTLWSLRRRYCPDCRLARLCSLDSCPDFLRWHSVLPSEHLIIDGERGYWVDREQMNAIVHEHEHALDKDQFLRDKRKQYNAIYYHAGQCRTWEERRARKRRFDLDQRREERNNSIFERLRHLGHEREIDYFGNYAIRQHHKPYFRTSKPLTDKEWTAMLPEWLETMNELRSLRLERSVYQTRKSLLTSAYDDYTASLSAESPAFELLPDVTELARFTPFHDLIHAPEETQVGRESFELLFEQLPALVDEWKTQLDAQFSELVDIPSGLSMASTTTQAAPDKLRLACAMFGVHRFNSHYAEATAPYPEVLASCGSTFPAHDEPGRTWSLEDQFGIRFLKDAVYIIHACGLDPHVATAEDMDRQNARLKCLMCKRPMVMTWKSAIRHAAVCHIGSERTLPMDACWERIADVHMDAIEAVEASHSKGTPPYRTRCLLCHNRIGDGALRDETERHLVGRHRLVWDAIQPGVHYRGLILEERRPIVEMVVDDEGAVTFKLPSF